MVLLTLAILSAVLAATAGSVARCMIFAGFSLSLVTDLADRIVVGSVLMLSVAFVLGLALMAGVLVLAVERGGLGFVAIVSHRHWVVGSPGRVAAIVVHVGSGSGDFVGNRHRLPVIVLGVCVVQLAIALTDSVDDGFRLGRLGDGDALGHSLPEGAGGTVERLSHSRGVGLDRGARAGVWVCVGARSHAFRPSAR